MNIAKFSERENNENVFFFKIHTPRHYKYFSTLMVNNYINMSVVQHYTWNSESVQTGLVYYKHIKTKMIVKVIFFY